MLQSEVLGRQLDIEMLEIVENHFPHAVIVPFR
jgi:hypothetical protein